MTLTNLQKRSAQAIVNIFETGRPDGDYGRATLLAGDPGQLTYGRSQATLASGNLYLLIRAYCEAKDNQLGPRLQLYLPKLALRDSALNNNLRFRNLLCNAGDDPVMHRVQDDFFDRVFWNPSLAEAQKLGIVTALGITVIYDSMVHGSWARMRDQTISSFGGRPQQSDEKLWLTSYINERHHWLTNHSIPILRMTAYRMYELQTLIIQKKWDLELPMVVRGITINLSVLTSDFGNPVRASAHTEQRLLYLAIPFMRGEDVKVVQAALSDRNHSITIDSTFGPKTENAIKQFQASQGLKIDGIVGNATRTALGIE